MIKTDFSSSLLLEQSPKQVYESINNVQAWWSGEITGCTDQLNEVFSYRSGEYHFSKQKILTLMPYERIEWEVTESKLTFLKDANEWTGTTIIFEISVKDHKTHLHFTHIGLKPDIECFNACSNGWSKLIQQSLLSLITTGQGKKVF